MAAHVALEIMDTTLRDGEQTPELAYTPAEKVQIGRVLLREVQVDRIEVASARASEGEAEAVRRICTWARRQKLLERIEVLGFADVDKSVDWIVEQGGKVLNLLTKGSRHHCEEQLRMTPERHFKGIADTVRCAQGRGAVVNVYLEDWSHGVRDSFDYVFSHVSQLQELGVRRVMLPDTLGVLSPADVTRYFGLMVETWPDLHFDFHGQNDYGLATANSIAAVRAGARGVHTSVNGLGERAGNTHLAELVAAIHDMTPARTRVNESKLTMVSDVVSTFSGKVVGGNMPVVGRDVFTHTAGIHADGESKGRLYTTRLHARRFGRRQRYALGKLAGKASLDQNLRALGIRLQPESRDLVLQRIVELGDKKHSVTAADLPLIIADVLKTPSDQLVHIDEYDIRSTSRELPTASVRVSYQGRTHEESATGDGGYDAFVKALAKAARKLELKLPQLVDYKVRIPPGGRSGALVETVITWRASPRSAPFATLGVDSDQVAAAVIATEKMLNLVASRSAPRS